MQIKSVFRDSGSATPKMTAETSLTKLVVVSLILVFVFDGSFNDLQVSLPYQLVRFSNYISKSPSTHSVHFSVDRHTFTARVHLHQILHVMSSPLIYHITGILHVQIPSDTI